MMSDYRGSVAVVTGGASGLGQAVTVALAEAGMRVVILDRQMDAGQEQAESVGGHFFAIDVSNTAAVASAVAQVKELGTPRVLVNCAGIAGAAKTVSRGEPHQPELFEKTIAVNLVGTFNVCSQVAALMVSSEPIGADDARGVIINTASVAAYDGQVGQSAYAASKGGIVAMTLPMARDLADKGVRVCAIAPGLFLTPLLNELPDDVQDSLGAQVPFPSRLGQPDEYARMVCSIIDNPMLNGEVIRLDGAIRMSPR
ncbi:MAG: SDR family NAD(P)-dependent oxidoreductase [Granulosicoccus sp.]